MSDDQIPFHAHDIPRQPQAGEHLWTVTNGAALHRAELRDYGKVGCELQILNEADFLNGWRFEHRTLALMEAAVMRDALLGQGWTCGRCAGAEWLCEEHPTRAANHEGCTGAGEPCPMCNTTDPPRPPKGFVSYFRTGDT